MGDEYNIALQIVYVANVFIVGYVGSASLFFPTYAAQSLFEDSIASTATSLRVLGAVYVSIAILSIAGIFYPLKMAAILAIQLVYKVLWLLTVAAPLAVSGKSSEIPITMFLVFVIYVLALLFIIPFDFLFSF